MKDADPGIGSGNGMSRRTLLTGATVAGLTACGGGQMTRAEQSEKTELEITNETLVNNFCRDWGLRDVEALRPYLAEDLLYQITPGQPLIESRQQFEKQMGRWLNGLESVQWEILRSHAIGPVVLNERIDHFNAPEGGKGPSMRFHVVGHFFIENGVIQVWKDWPMPGAEQFIG
jgi:limonene-1,2-epoxide hydrolase